MKIYEKDKRIIEISDNKQFPYLQREELIQIIMNYQYLYGTLKNGFEELKKANPNNLKYCPKCKHDYYNNCITCMENKCEEDL